MKGLLAPKVMIVMKGEDKGEYSDCPIATQDIEVNLKNREKAIEKAQYGPLNPDEPNTQYWRDMGAKWRVSGEQAKKSRCGNCAAFNQKSEMLDCIEQGLGEEDEWDAVDAGNLGFCEIFDFKCAAARTCAAWVTGGPITDDSDEESMGEGETEESGEE
jgi:hypothetical protein